MILNKRLRIFTYVKSKIFLSVFFFSLGFVIHFLISHSETNENDAFEKTLSSHLEFNNNNKNDKKNVILLVILIFSSISNFSKRQVLRETWISDIQDNKNVKYYFVISEGNAKEDEKASISFEQNKYKDLIVFPNLEDSFYLLTHKLLATFIWLTDNKIFNDENFSQTFRPFKNFNFILKCDDDTFVRVNEILNELSTTYSNEKGENLYWGFFDGRARVKKSGKYKEDQWDICDYYIPYALGGGYILAQPLVKYIAKNEKFLKKFKSEDVSVGAWLSTYSNLNRVHDPRFDTEYISRGCHQSYLITHKHSEIAMKKFYKNLKTYGKLCQKEFRTRMSYNYNWNVVPSKCCSRVNPNVP